MNLGSLVGFLSGVFFLAVSILLAAAFDFDTVLGLVNVASLVIVFGGTASVTLVANSFEKIGNACKALTYIFTNQRRSPFEAIDNLIVLSNLARRKGLIVLDVPVKTMNDPFLQKGINLVADGTDPEVIRNILTIELDYMEIRHKEVRRVWDFIGTQAPIWGLIGTLFGVIMMLFDMNNPDVIGARIAFALVAMLYGSILAHFIAIPISTKLANLTQDEMLIKRLLIEGILSIQSGETTATIDQKLKSFISPKLRNKVRGGESDYL